MNELNGYLKERATYTNKLERANKKIKNAIGLEKRILENEINLFNDNLTIINNVIETIKFNGEKY